ncbi:hypothetical protein BHS09_17975 [Myxococcus xanthus]|uniref:Uncharacterized protein n=1 Tax=Myxococcus xanthus TaxID=34 RepID=A0AAE6G139_MYXXA|nr:type VI immunity family protein [Myxococcus xanthus]QDE68714.1 hypothetical protein BHS09_17975 [Myxococcus xanthus]QDE75990.1 hypothetical protein BHS08_17990 [Myxococcus xanthus]
MSDTATLIDSLDLRDEEGIRQASFTFSINLFTTATFAEFPLAALRCQEIFLSVCPPERLRFYATETMRKHRAVTKKTLGTLARWATEPLGKKDYVSLELKDGDSEMDAPKALFKFTSAEEGSPSFKSKNANSVTLAFPPELGLQRAGELQALLMRLLETVPCVCATTGFAFHVTRYSSAAAEAYAMRTSMRYPETDIIRISQDHRAVQQNALKTVAWLTMVFEPLLSELGRVDAVVKGWGRQSPTGLHRVGRCFGLANDPHCMIASAESRRRTPGRYIWRCVR